MTSNYFLAFPPYQSKYHLNRLSMVDHSIYLVVFKLPELLTSLRQVSSSPYFFLLFFSQE